MDLPVAAPPQIVECVEQAHERYAVPRGLLLAILRAESQFGTHPGGRVGEQKPDGDGAAFGPMQIHSVWLEELSRYGIEARTLRDSLCTNIAVGAWILRRYYERFGDSWAKAVMAYNAGYRLENGYQYARKVIRYWLEYTGKNEGNS